MAKRSMTQSRFTVGLIVLCLLAFVVYLAGNWSFALLDRDEGWYAQISREMARTGEWVVPHFRGEVFHGKPVFAFWCQGVTMRLLGETPFAARLPSALATVAVLFIVGLFTRMAGPRRALWTVAVLASAVLLLVLSKMCLTDTLLLLWITACELSLYAMYRGRDSWLVVLLFWVCVGLAILTKGPVVVGVLGGTLLALAALDVGSHWRSPSQWALAVRWWLRARPWIGLPVMIAVVAPWVLLVQNRDPGFLGTTWWRSMFGPIATGALEGHSGWPGYYLTMIWAVWMPWSLLLVPVILRAWRNRQLSPARFALAAVIGPCLVIEIVRQKLPHYLLPVFPALAFLTADLIVHSLRGRKNELTTALVKWGATAWALAVVALGFAPFAANWPSLAFDSLPWVPMAMLALLGVAAGVLICVCFWKERPAVALYAMAAGTAAVGVLLFAAVLPATNYMRLSPRIAEVLRQQGISSDDVGVIDDHKLGYAEPSLSFYLGCRARYLDNARELSELTPAQWPAAIIATDAVYDQMPAEIRNKLQPVSTLRGWAFGGSNRIVNVMVLRRVG